jgi:RimJ/RimL family protein N-acetyltransferase
MHIRTARVDDAGELVRYAADLFAEDLPGIYRRDAPTLAEEGTFIGSHIEPDNSTLLLAEDGGRIVGIIGFLGRTLADERHVGEFGLSVAKEYRGRGIGAALIEALLEWAPSHGIARIEARSWASNPGATKLYQRMGFVLEGRATDAIRRDGRSIDVDMLALLLGE